MPDLPSGTVTFLFTDIEESTVSGVMDDPAREPTPIVIPAPALGDRSTPR